MGKVKKGKKKSNSSKKTELDETKQNQIVDKLYITREIETSITLLESPENSVVLESLLFLSKYADIQRNNLFFIQSCGLLPKLLALLDHNICILRVSLRLLSQLLTIGAAQIQLNEDKFDGHILKICNFYVRHPDINVKEFSTLILEKYIELGKIELLLNEPDLLKTILKAIKTPETEIVLNSSLELFNRVIEIPTVRSQLPLQENFKLDDFIARMSVSTSTFRKILAIFEKITYFCDDPLQTSIKECKVLEHVLATICDPEKKDYLFTCLNIVTHSMRNEITNTCFVQSLEFLKFCQWVKTCPVEVMPICANIFLELSKIDSIRQMLFDLSVEDVILSFLRSDDKKILNTVFNSLSFMSKHKYCCEKIVTPLVVKKLVQVLSTVEDSDEPYNETAVATLAYFSRRDARTLHMLRAYSEVGLLMNYLKMSNLPEHIHKKILDIVNMFVTNNQLRSYVLSPDLYDLLLAQIQSKSDEISIRSVEIMVNCMNDEEFRNHFLAKSGSKIVTSKLANTHNEKLVRTIAIFLHNAMMYEDLSKDLVHSKILLALKHLPEGIKYRNPLIGRIMSLVYNMCLPVKFFETGRLELVDKIKGRFYIMTGTWREPFPFLEILEMRHISTKSTIYVVDDSTTSGFKDNYRIGLQYVGRNVSVMSISSYDVENIINYGGLSRDPYFLKYSEQVRHLVSGVSSLRKKAKILAEFVEGCLCGPSEECEDRDKLHSFELHIACLKKKLGTNMIPIGYLRLGFHCERALLFKALADQVYLPATLVRGRKVYWNEVALIEGGKTRVLKMFVVDLMNNIGELLPVGSRECNAYCDIQ